MGRVSPRGKSRPRAGRWREDKVYRDITPAAFAACRAQSPRKVVRGDWAAPLREAWDRFDGVQALADIAILRSSYAAKTRSRDDAALAIEPGMRCR